MSVLAKDTHRENADAKLTMADMTMQIVQARQGVIDNNGADPKVRKRLKDGGADLDTELLNVNKGRSGNRRKTASLRIATESLDTAKTTIHDLNTQNAIVDAQNDLKLRVFEGQTLRPDDLTVAWPPTDSKNANIPAPATSAGKNRGPHLTAATTPTAPKGNGRKSPRR